MADTLEGRPKQIFTEGKNYAHVSVPRQDGTVQSVIVWTHADDEGNVTLNSAEGRYWPANLRKAGTATIVDFGKLDEVLAALPAATLKPPKAAPRADTTGEITA